MWTAQEEREEDKLMKRSEVEWKMDIFLLGQLLLHAADICDIANNNNNKKPSLLMH